MSNSRHILHPGNKQAADSVKAQLAAICGSARLRSFRFAGKTYFNVEAEIEGDRNELVVIGAHLDSTAANDKNYDPKTSSAPGADDDGSGVSGVLAVATRLKALANQKKPRRSIRFVLFNAEEQGMVGSWEYARQLKEREGERGAPSVVEMIAMDMIGWHRPGRPRFVFEIHGTGSSDYPDAKPGSDKLASRLASAARQLAPDLEPEVYPLGNRKTDPATGRSDHSSFHYHDWPACLVSEDMWVGNLSADAGNPAYHSATDLPASLFPDYAADIARTVAAVAWMDANA